MRKNFCGGGEKVPYELCVATRLILMFKVIIKCLAVWRSAGSKVFDSRRG